MQERSIFKAYTHKKSILLAWNERYISIDVRIKKKQASTMFETRQIHRDFV